MAGELLCLWSAQDLEALLLDARDFNRHNGLTGVLLYSGRNFMQCLEGPPDAVARAYARIRASSRHTDITELMDAPIEQRAFSGWVMGATVATPSEFVAVSTAKWLSRSALAASPPAVPPGLGRLQVFWEMRLDAR